MGTNRTGGAPLKDANIDASDIDLIIAGRSTPDGMFPTVASRSGLTYRRP
jgi:3-oxoacyl-[acyl-carrier-protein] synthase III